jgi:choline dehydrogenase-like flavoprotein
MTFHSTPVHQQPVHVREAIIQAWIGSRFVKMRSLAKAIVLLGISSWVSSSPLYRKVSGYPDVPENWRPGPYYDYSFLQFKEDAVEPAVIETDVVIVGSGCGGAVCAKVLADAGLGVVVVDKGYYFSTSHLPMPQDQGMHHLYENGGIVSSTDSSVAVVAGSCWGGGGTVNWSVGLQTQGYVRREWAEQRCLPFFATQEFQACLDRVCDFMGVTDDNLRQSHRGQILLDGARRLGWHAKPTPQNTGGAEHWCGHCHLGCASAEKRGPTVSWLPAAAKNGAKFIEGFHVDRVLFDERAKDKTAVGIIGKWTSRDPDGGVIGDKRATRDVVIKARKVIVSAGSLWSPIILLKSGLTVSNTSNTTCMLRERV